MLRALLGFVVALPIACAAPAQSGEPSESPPDPASATSSAPNPTPASSSDSPPAIPGADPEINERWAKATPEDAARTLEAESREVWVARRKVVDALDLEAGQRIADVGAGSGFFAKLFAARVGPEGRVYAIDIAPALVEGLAAWAEAEGVSSLEAVLGAPDDVRLPERSVDVVFTSDTYHHFEDPAAVLASVRRALRPGGRLFVLDFERVPGTSPDWILEHVRAGKSAVIAELESAGFTFVREVPMSELEENYLIELRAPSDR